MCGNSAFSFLSEPTIWSWNSPLVTPFPQVHLKSPKGLKTTQETMSRWVDKQNASNIPDCLLFSSNSQMKYWCVVWCRYWDNWNKPVAVESRWRHDHSHAKDPSSQIHGNSKALPTLSRNAERLYRQYQYQTQFSRMTEACDSSPQRPPSKIR